MTERYYSSTAEPTTLALNVTAAQTIIEVASLVGYPPSFPYTLCLDFDTGLRELVQVTNAAGTTLTVTRAFDGTSAIDHSAGATVRHVTCAIDEADSRAHENASVGVHGISGAVVGTTDSQSLSNKTLVNPIITDPSLRDVTIMSSTNGDVSLTVSALPAQTANMFEMFDDSGFKRLTVDRDGTLNTFSGDTTLGYAAKVDPAAANNDISNLSVRDKANATTLILRANGQITSSVSEDRFMVDLQRPATVTSDAIAYRRAGVHRFNVADDGSVSTQGGLTVVGAVTGGTNLTTGTWTTYSPSWTVSGGGAPSYGDATVRGRYARVGRTIHLNIAVTFGAGSTFGGGSWRFGLPVAMSSSAAFASFTIQGDDASAGSTFGGHAKVTAANSGFEIMPYTTGVAFWSATHPFAWTTSDTVMITGTYEAAS